MVLPGHFLGSRKAACGKQGWRGSLWLLELAQRLGSRIYFPACRSFMSEWPHVPMVGTTDPNPNLFPVSLEFLKP